MNKWRVQCFCFVFLKLGYPYLCLRTVHKLSSIILIDDRCLLKSWHLLLIHLLKSSTQHFIILTDTFLKLTITFLYVFVVSVMRSCWRAHLLQSTHIYSLSKMLLYCILVMVWPIRHSLIHLWYLARCPFALITVLVMSSKVYICAQLVQQTWINCETLVHT